MSEHVRGSGRGRGVERRVGCLVKGGQRKKPQPQHTHTQLNKLIDCSSGSEEAGLTTAER